ncbi:MAG: sulfotransferase [Nitrosomonadales bacterium]|nr:sulfotransferase [Nitrosomonadales bacterium]
MDKITRPAVSRLPFDPIFVCGAPRSGTTLLLSLICTSRAANPLSAECDYLTALVHPYIVGRNRFDLHTNCYFASLGDFEHYHADIMRGVLADMWEFLERPAKLVLKDPGMTRYANIILRLLPESRMIVSIRDPKDVVASRVSIEMRRLGSDDPGDIGNDFIEAICREYNAVHEYVLTLDENALQRVKLVRYEQLVNGIGLPELSAFIGVTDIDTEFLWQRSLKMGERKSHSEWLSPLYGKKMSGDSIGRYRKVLGETAIALIDDACMPTYNKLLDIGGWNEQA